MHQQGQETADQKAVLIKLLRAELMQIVDTPAPYDRTKAFYVDPIRIGAPTRLLDGKVLEAKKDERLMAILLTLNATISVFNDFVLVTNEAQANGDPPLRVHEQWYRDMSGRLENVITVRNEILAVLGSP